MGIEATDEACLVKGLPAAEQDRLAQILDDYLTAVERGDPITPEELLRRHPHDSEYLRGYLSGLQLFHQAADSIVADSSLVSQAGKVVGDYRLLRELGRGGMGVVFEAEQISLRRRVALKILPSSVSQSRKHLLRFQNEAQAAAQICHPHIVPVFSVGDDEGVHFYAMQLIEGQSLATWLGREQVTSGECNADTTEPRNSATVIFQQGSKIALGGSRANRVIDPESLKSAAGVRAHIAQVARWGMQAAEGIHAAHEYGVVHRDIKPSNLLIDSQLQLWITDFGLARCRENVGVTETGDIMGTMRYMSPEQALGRNELVDHRTDVYSLGITLYELATLHHPADCLSDAHLFFDRTRVSYKPLRYWNRHIPQDFQTIVSKAMSEFPHERYSTAQDMADDLQRFMNGESILASPPSLLKRSGKWARRHRPLVWMAAAALLVIVTGAISSSVMLAHKNLELQQAFVESHDNLHESHVVLDQVTGLADQLAAIPGAEGVRYQLLQLSVEHLEHFVEKAGDVPELAIDLALAYRNRGRLNRKLLNEESALKELTLARDQLASLVSQDPANLDFAQNLAMCQNDLGLVLCDLGREEEAIEALSEAEHRLIEIRASAPDQQNVNTDLATTKNNLGMGLQVSGRQEEAANKFREAIKILRPLTIETPDDEAVLRSLAASYNNLGILAGTDNREAAIEYYQQAISLQQRLVSLHKVNRIYLDELAKAYNNLGYALARGQEWTEAQASYGDAIRIQENLVKASPFAVSYRRDLAISLNNLGMAQSQNGDLTEAEKSFRNALKIQEPLLNDDYTTDAKTLSDVGGMYNNLGLLLDQLDRYAEAESSFQQAIRCQSKAFKLSPDAERYRKLLQNHYVNYEKCLEKQHKLQAALAVSLKRNSILAEDAKH